jgi:uncharacterized protein YgiM (DUF1202 family)
LFFWLRRKPNQRTLHAGDHPVRDLLSLFPGGLVMQRPYFRALIAVLTCLTAVASLSLALAAPATPDPSVLFQTGPYATSNGAVFVRGGPGVGFWILGTLFSGEAVPILAVSPDGAWWYINAPFGEGWVAGISVTAANTAGVSVRDPGPIGTVTTGSLTVRFGPGELAASLGHLGQGDQVYVLAQNADGSWFQVRWAFGTGWVSGRFLSVTGVPQTVSTDGQGGGVPVTSQTPYAIVMATYLNVRTGPGPNYAILGQVFAGDTLPIVGRTNDRSWYQVETPFGTGWVYAPYVATRNEFGGAPVTSASAAAAAVTGPTGIVNTGALHIRSGPGPQYTSLGTLAGGTETQIIGRSADWSWWLLDTPVGTGWASALYILARGDISSVPYVAPGTAVQPSPGLAGGAAPQPALTGPMAVVITGSLHIRSGPNSTFPSLGAVNAGTRMPIIGQSKDRGWWLVESPFGNGWVSKLYVLVNGNASAVPVQ